ncbi:hypothetical protein H6771_01195 [Candidatus Peribacteria bacterium]|nr:hypothetical protein [Candidatus Peribacteria bacterium]
MTAVPRITRLLLLVSFLAMGLGVALQLRATDKTLYVNEIQTIIYQSVNDTAMAEKLETLGITPLDANHAMATRMLEINALHNGAVVAVLVSLFLLIFTTVHLVYILPHAPLLRQH